MHVCLCVPVWASNDDGWFKPKAQTDLINSVSEYHWREKAQERERVKNREAMKIKELFIATGISQFPLLDSQVVTCMKTDRCSSCFLCREHEPTCPIR